MQTAVEWLVDQMFKQGYFDGNKPLSITNLDHLQHQAKEMEKQQIIDAYANAVMKENNSDYVGMHEQSSGEIYYNETYESKGSDDQVPNVGNMVSSQTEISDEEIEQLARDYILYNDSKRQWVIEGMKLYREQLKQK